VQCGLSLMTHDFKNLMVGDAIISKKDIKGYHCPVSSVIDMNVTMFVHFKSHDNNSLRLRVIVNCMTESQTVTAPLHDVLLRLAVKLLHILTDNLNGKFGDGLFL